MSFSLSKASLAELNGVHPSLVAVVKRAITTTDVDFGVHDGLRSIETQRAYVARGVSWTMASKHRAQPDGFGHAVDLVPYINGKLRWEWPAIYPIAAAVWQAANELGIALRWGGPWIDMRDIKSGSPAAMKAAVEAYGARQRARGRKAFTDGPHFELA